MTFLEGVIVGRRATIVASIVVNRDVPLSIIVGGIPAKVIMRYWRVEHKTEREHYYTPLQSA